MAWDTGCSTSLTLLRPNSNCRALLYYSRLHSSRCNRHLQHSMAKAPPNSPDLYQHMQQTFCPTSHRVELAPTTPDFKSSKTSKLTNPYHHSNLIKQIDRNTTELSLSKQHSVSTHKPVHKPKILLIKTHIFYNIYNQTNKSSNLLYKARLHAQKGGGDKSTNLKTYQNISYHCVQQMASRGKAVHDAIMRSLTDTNMEDIENTMVIETTQIKRTQEAKRGSSSSKRKKNTELTTGLKDTPRDFWLGIMAMEKLAIDEGVKTKDCRPSMKKEDLIEMGIPEGEAEDMSQLTRSHSHM